MLTLFRGVVALALFSSGAVCLYHGLWLTSIFLFYACGEVVTYDEDQA